MRSLTSLTLVGLLTVALVGTSASARPGGRSRGGSSHGPGGQGRTSGQGRAGGGNAGSHAREGTQAGDENRRLGGQERGDRANSPAQSRENFRQNATGGQSDRPSREQVQGFLDGQQGRDFQERASQSRDQLQSQGQQIRSSVEARASELFTPAWYAQHPQAWQYTHPHADAWAAATLTTATAWIAGATAAGTGSSGSSGDTGEGATDEAASEETDEASTATEVGTTAAAPAVDPSQWLSLGVFAVAPQGQSDANQIVQLAVDKKGIVQGTFFDAITGADQSLAGAVEPTSYNVTFSVGSAKEVVFRTTIENLTREQAPLVLTFGDGRQQQWTSVRLRPTGFQGD